MLPREEGNRWGSNHTGAFDGCAAVDNSCTQYGCDPVAGLACIHTEKQAGVTVACFYLVSKRQSNRVNSRGIKWRLASDAAYPIRAEKFSHRVKLYFQE
jgi:hypothetical protein